jgi:hypothetical protein
MEIWVDKFMFTVGFGGGGASLWRVLRMKIKQKDLKQQRQ